METLIDTSPVGVAVFDAGTGGPRYFNRETRRIVDGPRNPDQTPEMLLDVLTCRRADGRTVSLAEMPLSEVLRLAETVHTEEVVLGVPDGRRVIVLLNATPIIADEGKVESVVVTMQDLTAVEEQDRLRAEFLAVVSHELRMPLTSVMGAATTLLNAAADLDPAEVRQFHRIIVERADHMRALIGDLLAVARIPVIFLSAYGRDEVVARVLEQGATDYLVKPFAPTELVARVRAALRRVGDAASPEPADPFVLGDLTIDYARRRVTVAGRPAPLTPTEFDLLAALAAEAGRVVPHDRLRRRVWRPGKPGNLRVLRTHLMRLRRKLGDDAANPAYIFAEPRVGYRMPAETQTRTT